MQNSIGKTQKKTNFLNSISLLFQFYYEEKTLFLKKQLYTLVALETLCHIRLSNEKFRKLILTT